MRPFEDYDDSLSKDETKLSKGFLSASLVATISGIVGTAVKETAGQIIGILSGIGFNALVSVRGEKNEKAYCGRTYYSKLLGLDLFCRYNFKSELTR